MAERTDKNSHTVIMIGAGPAALSAAIYTTREDIETVLLEKAIPGGMAAITDVIDNYPGFPQGVPGTELALNLQQQAERFGAVIEPAEVLGLHDEGEWKRVETTDGDLYAKAILVATGSDYKKLGIPGEAEYYARGVHYCATCDGAFYRDKRIAVIGGGNSAVQEAIFLTRFATHIDLMVRSKLRASDVLIKELQEYIDAGKVTIHLATTTDEIRAGEDKLVNSIVGTDTATGKKVEIAVNGVFVFIGLDPNSKFLNGALELDEIGLIKTNQNLESSMDGVFVAGDIRSGATMQVASAVGEGATAALKIREYLEELHRAEVA